MPCQEPIVGGKCKLYYNSATVATPTWVEIKEVGDVSIPDLNSNLAEISTRSSTWIRNLPAQQTLAVEFTYLYKADPTVWTFLRDAFFNQSSHEFAVMDGDITVTGTEGLRLPAFVENFPITQNLEDISMVDTVRLALAYMCDADTLVDPSWYTVA